ncbi:MAG: hypothetical protein ACYC6G_15225 [Desulfobaccales bacterium]
MKASIFSTRPLTTDALFGVQICFPFIFGGSQFYRMLTTNKASWLAATLVWLIR